MINALISDPQVVAGEYELKETNVNWSPEDFESKLQVRPMCRAYVNGLYIKCMCT